MISVSRLRKIHNMNLALTALRQGGAEIKRDITAKDLVEGHREKTLEMLWAIIFTSLMHNIPLGAERIHRIRFRENFDKFIVNVRGFLFVK